MVHVTGIPLGYHWDNQDGSDSQHSDRRHSNDTFLGSAVSTSEVPSTTGVLVLWLRSVFKAKIKDSTESAMIRTIY